MVRVIEWAPFCPSLVQTVGESASLAPPKTPSNNPKVIIYAHHAHDWKIRHCGLMSSLLTSQKSCLHNEVSGKHFPNKTWWFLDVFLASLVVNNIRYWSCWKVFFPPLVDSWTNLSGEHTNDIDILSDNKWAYWSQRYPFKLINDRAKDSKTSFHINASSWNIFVGLMLIWM